jgi:WD40 repeat protein
MTTSRITSPHLFPLKAVKSLAFALLLSVFTLGILVSRGEAQYFGRNKVDYEKFQFKVLHTQHFDIYFYPEEADAVDFAGRMAERWYARHSEILSDSLHGRQPLILYASSPHFGQTNVIQGELGQGTGGVTEPSLRRIVMPFAGPLEETNHVIGHELVHAFQYDITGHGLPGYAGGLGSMEQLPLWFIEGMAEYLSLGPIDPNTAMWMRDATQHDLPSVSDLDNPKYFPYRYGQALLAYIGGRWGDKKLGRLLRVAGARGNIDRAIDSVLSIKPDSLSKAWHEALHKMYDPLVKETSKPSDYGPSVISDKNGGGELNVSPVLSPDGKQLVFFSERDLFSIDLYIADALTGKIKRNIFKAELDPHFQSLEFIYSAGAWDPSGKRFMFSAVQKGRPVLTLLNPEDGKIEREIRFPKLGEIYNPSWSPDGRYVAFSALDGGLSDLFIYDLQADSLRRLTDDAYADLEPAWSPDGKSLAFATDRFTTQLGDLKIGNYRLALMDVQSGRITPLPGFENAKNINPQWSPDGANIYFLSDRDGITNIYKLSVGSGHVTQITNLYGGVSGITAISPALSSSLDSNRLAYSVFEDGKYNIYRIDSSAVLAGKELSPEFTVGNPAILPPAHRLVATLVANLDNPDLGLPSDTTFNITDYSASLSLAGVGRPSVAVGVDRFGTYLGGGLALFWSDMLGNHNLATALQIQSSNGITDIAGLVGYLNTAHRWNWGVYAQQTPYITGSFSSGYGYDTNGEPVYIEQDYYYREINREIGGMISYPMSDVLRTEFSLGYRNITFSEQVQTIAVSLLTGATVMDNTQDLPSPSALNLAEASAALVYDNSYFGATSPILGQRYRLEIDPTFGSLNWIDVLADYRHYYMPLRPFTFALRLLHYGRYGPGAEDSRLTPLFIGYPGLVRGYDINSFDATEVATDSTGSGSVFDRLIGSKMFVGNAELRFPLFGVLGLGHGYYGVFPVELATFFDTGVAWSSYDKLPLFNGGPKPVSSIGGALRVNLGGYAIGEVDYVRPLDRPDKGWFWEFNLSEGF